MSLQLLPIILISLGVLLAVSWLAVRRLRFFQRWLARPHLAARRLLMGLVLELLGLACLLALLVQMEQTQRRQSLSELPQLMVLVDVSPSMQNDPGPRGQTKLQAARQVLRKLPAELPGVRLGLVGYSAFPVTYTPPTTDTALWLEQLDLVGPEQFKQAGTDLRQALLEGLRALRLDTSGQRPPQAVLIVSDGEHYGPSLASLSSLMRRVNIQPFCLNPVLAVAENQPDSLQLKNRLRGVYSYNLAVPREFIRELRTSLKAIPSPVKPPTQQAWVWLGALSLALLAAAEAIKAI